MKHINKIVLIILAISALLLLISFAFGFKLSDFKNILNGEGKYEKAEPYISDNNIENINIKIDQENIVIKTHDKENIEIHYYIIENQEVDIKESNNNLDIEFKNKKEFRFLFINIGFHIKHPTVEIFIPNNKELNINVNTETGNVSLDSLTVNLIFINLNTGNLSMKNVNCFSSNLTVKTGNITLNDIESENIAISNNVGNIDVINIKAPIININDKTGNITLKNIISQNLEVKNNVGSINSTNITANIVYLETQTGNISIKENNPYTLDLSVYTGNIKVNNQKQYTHYYLENGNNTFTVKLSTGNIDYN